MVNSNKQKYVDLVIDYIKQFPEKFNKLVVYGSAVDPNITKPESIDFAIGLVNSQDAKNYDLLGDLLSYIGDIVDDGDCTLLPIHDEAISKNCMTNILKGDVVYEV